ncbi:MAG: hypothetical protein P8N02_15190 [Actinomycetota bacterium]|nr:hypothetical protein [Actinomycetota bacterium]
MAGTDPYRVRLGPAIGEVESTTAPRWRLHPSDLVSGTDRVWVEAGHHDQLNITIYRPVSPVVDVSAPKVPGGPSLSLSNASLIIGFSGRYAVATASSQTAAGQWTLTEFNGTPLVPGTYTVQVDAPGYVPQGRSSIPPLSVATGYPTILEESIALDLDLAPNNTAELTYVLHDALGQPLRGVLVEDLLVLDTMPATGMPFLIAARTDAVVSVVTHEIDRQVLLRVPLLQPGQAPEEAFTMAGYADFGDGRTEHGLQAADGSVELWATSPGAEPTLLGSGCDPDVAADELLLVYADGQDLVVLDPRDWSELARHALGAEVRSPALTRTAELAAVVIGADVALVDLETGGTVAVDRPAGVEYASPTFASGAILGLLQDRTGVDSDSVSLYDLETGRVTSTIDLHADAVAIDLDVSGEWLAYVDVDGALHWVGRGTTGVIDDDGYIDVDW